MNITVIIPTFNRKEKLRKALQSVLNQKRKYLELIVIDDGSTDDTGQMIRREFPSVKYFFQANQGPAAARNRGIELSRGGWVAFLDSDDEWMLGKLDAQLEYFRENPDYLICQTEEIWIRNGARVNPMRKHQKYGGRIFEKCLSLCLVSPSAVMMRRKLFDEIGLFDKTLPACEDYDLWLRIAAKFPIGLINQPYVIKYGGHSDQRSKEFPAMDRFRILALAKLLRSGTLTREQSEAARMMLEHKAEIYIRGALKRGKYREIEDIQALLREAAPNKLDGAEYSGVKS